MSFTALGQTQQLTGTVLDQLGQPMDTIPVTWSSSTTGIAGVSATGLVTATGNGVASIIASAVTTSGEATVSVQQTPASITLTPRPPRPSGAR